MSHGGWIIGAIEECSSTNYGHLILLKAAWNVDYVRRANGVLDVVPRSREVRRPFRCPGHVTIQPYRLPNVTRTLASSKKGEEMQKQQASQPYIQLPEHIFSFQLASGGGRLACTIVIHSETRDQAQIIFRDNWRDIETMARNKLVREHGAADQRKRAENLSPSNASLDRFLGKILPPILSQDVSGGGGRET